jgi:hypothetical protein
MTMPPRLTVVGDLERPDHYHLHAGANCYFWGEYTPFEHTNGRKWNFSPTNHLVSNLKKKMDRQGRADWKYKQVAINDVAVGFSQFWKWKALHEAHRVALVPMPPSKARSDPMFDPRMLDVLQAIAARTNINLDIRDCLTFSGSHSASHEAEARPTPDALHEDLAFDPVAGRPSEQPGAIFVFDDMLTTGAHFVAATRRLAEVFPGVQVIGNFVARRIVANPFGESDF